MLGKLPKGHTQHAVCPLAGASSSSNVSPQNKCPSTVGSGFKRCTSVKLLISPKTLMGHPRYISRRSLDLEQHRRRHCLPGFYASLYFKPLLSPSPVPRLAFLFLFLHPSLPCHCPRLPVFNPAAWTPSCQPRRSTRRIWGSMFRRRCRFGARGNARWCPNPFIDDFVSTISRAYFPKFPFVPFLFLSPLWKSACRVLWSEPCTNKETSSPQQPTPIGSTLLQLTQMVCAPGHSGPAPGSISAWWNRPQGRVFWAVMAGWLTADRRRWHFDFWITLHASSLQQPQTEPVTRASKLSLNPRGQTHAQPLQEW